MNKYALPQVGDIITVTTRYVDPSIGSGEFSDTIYENVCVAPSFTWTRPNEFCIPAEGEPFIAKRTISLNHVHKLIVHKGNDGTEVCTSGTRFVKVPGSKGNEYTVTVLDGFGIECECLGFTYRRQCKHLKIASEAV